MANEKFRRALGPLFRCGSIVAARVLCVGNVAHERWIGPPCFLFVSDGSSDVIAAGLGLVPRGGRGHRTSGRRSQVGIGAVTCIFRVVLVGPSGLLNGSKLLLFFSHVVHLACIYIGLYWPVHAHKCRRSRSRAEDF